MTARRLPFEGSVSALLLSGAIAAILLSSRASAQTYEGEAPPPPPPAEDDAQPPPDALPPAQPPDQNTFERGLSPYGRWIDTPEYGRVWVPYDAAPDWQPYTDGRWVDTQWGWSFASTVPWGWAAFHYGRWGYGLGLGWFWVPGFVWAPAWVSWRYYPGFVCWSPFAPVGFVFGRHWPGWVVMPGVHFTHPIVRFRIPRPHAAPIVRAANPVARIAPPTARARFAPPRSASPPPNVRAGGSVRPGTPPRATPPRAGSRGFTRSTWRGANTFRRSFNVATVRSFPARAAARSTFAGGSHRFSTARTFAMPSRGTPRRR
jgi:hypothetical protein